MTSITINNEYNNLSDILSYVQVAGENAGLDSKQNLRMRLLAEELTGMLKGLTGNFGGEFCIERDGLKFLLLTRITLLDDMDNKTKKNFINVSSDKKNAAAKGIMGKIRDVVENMLYPENAIYSANYIGSELEVDVLLGNTWSLNKYKKNEKVWDEIEKSIVANLADEVTVSVKGKHVEIAITKNFG